MRNTLFILFITLLASCGISTKKTSACYSSINGNDTIAMTIAILNDDVKGKLDYNLFEKDKNTGALYGHMHGDTLIADYVFMSEGLTSTRQVAFLRKGNTMVEGFGPLAEKDGKFIFASVDSINFSSGVALTEISCDNEGSK